MRFVIKFVTLMVAFFAIYERSSLGAVVTVCSLRGQATVVDRNGNIRTLGPRDMIRFGERIQTDADTLLQLSLVGGDVITLGANASVVIDDYVVGTLPDTIGEVLLRKFQGACRVCTGKIIQLNPERFRIIARHSGGGIRGTEVEVEELSGGDEFVLRSGGPFDLYELQDFSVFEDSLFFDSTNKSLETMNVQAFADAATLQGVELLEFIAGGRASRVLTEPNTAIQFIGGGWEGPSSAGASSVPRGPCQCIPEPSAIAIWLVLGGIPLVAGRGRRRQ